MQQTLTAALALFVSLNQTSIITMGGREAALVTARGRQSCNSPLHQHLVSRTSWVNGDFIRVLLENKQRKGLLRCFLFHIWNIYSHKYAQIYLSYYQRICTVQHISILLINECHLPVVDKAWYEYITWMDMTIEVIECEWLLTR